MRKIHKLKGGSMKPGYAIIITVLVLGTVAGITCGIYFAGLNEVTRIIPPIKIPPINIPPASNAKQPASNAKVRACTGGCTSTQQCVNNQCKDICFGNCVLNSCAADDGCGSPCCSCNTGSTCVSNQCTIPGTCSPTCGAGMLCQNGNCVSACSPACSTGQECVNGTCTAPTSTCSPICKSNEKCVNNTCVCQPNCPANSCGSDGCSGTCACPTGQTCSNQTCSSCVPNCTAGVCGTSDNCGGVCGCTAGNVCQSGTCVTDNSPWVGWATTTQFGSGEDTWGSSNPAIYLPLVNDPTLGRMGGAAPWRTICQGYGGKQEQIQTVVDSALGNNTEKACLLIQPINKYPDEISGVTDPMFPTANMCDSSKSSCTDVNHDSIVAVDGNGNPYPTYLIVPYEGCGGNCKVTANSSFDCVNDCLVGDDQIPGITCDWGNLKGPLCNPAKVMFNDGNWGWNDTMKNNLLQYSDLVAITPETDYGRSISTAIANANEDHANYCTGQNQHVDIAATTPYWMNLPKGNTSSGIAYLTADSNIMLRYKPVPCNYFGNVDLNVPASATTLCPEGYYQLWDPTASCSTTKLLPGDPKWPNSEKSVHACCKSGGGSGQCSANQVYQATGGACPCSTGQCFFSLTPPLDGSSGKCGQCNSSSAACAVGTKC